MRFLAFLIMAGVILSLARALTLVLVLILAVSLIWAVITKPLELLGFVLLMLLSQLISASPVAFIIALTSVAILVVLRSPANRPSDP